MTVSELFGHFSRWFEKICYFDETNNIEDVSYIINNNNEDFLNEYGDFYVDYWEYDKTEDCMTIRISNDFKCVD